MFFLRFPKLWNSGYDRPIGGEHMSWAAVNFVTSALRSGVSRVFSVNSVYSAYTAIVQCSCFSQSSISVQYACTLAMAFCSVWYSCWTHGGNWMVIAFITWLSDDFKRRAELYDATSVDFIGRYAPAIRNVYPLYTRSRNSDQTIEVNALYLIKIQTRLRNPPFDERSISIRRLGGRHKQPNGA